MNPKHNQRESVTLERPLQALATVPSDMTPIIPADRPDEAVLRYVRELAKRLAREDHEAEITARQAPQLATSDPP